MKVKDATNMPNHRISKDKRALALALLGGGNTVNGITRVLKIGKMGLLRFIREAGEACKAWHRTHIRNVIVENLEIDEQWSWVHTYKERIREGEDRTGKGDSWLWAAVCRDSKAVLGR